MVRGAEKATLHIDLKRFDFMRTGDFKDRFISVPLHKIGKVLCNELVVIVESSVKNTFRLEYKKNFPLYQEQLEETTAGLQSPSKLYEKQDNDPILVKGEATVSKCEGDGSQRLTTPPQMQSSHREEPKLD